MDDSSANLLSMKTHTENNNTLETHTFQVSDYELVEKQDRSIFVTKRRTRLLFIVAWIFVGFAVLFLIGAVVLFVVFSGKEEGTAPPPTISPTLSSSVPVITSSTVSPSFSSPSIPSTAYVSKTTHSTLISSVESTRSSISESVSSSMSVVVSKTSMTLDSSVYIPSTSVISVVILTETVTTATVTITTPASECSSNEFRCSDGSCIEDRYVCDGKPHCPMADDEHKDCECSASQFRCHSGQCVDIKFRCDVLPNCFDRSDEMNCSNCSGFQCASGQCLWTNSVRCNDVVDCLDLSDELNCAWRPRSFRCNNGLWIANSKVCDGVDDCYDNSDESDDKCSICNIVAEMQCGDLETCVMRDWKCDGFTDCSNGFDELNCGTCSSEEFKCTDYSCIPSSQVCDGVKQCPLGTDEVDCLQLFSNGNVSYTSGVVMMKSGNQFKPVCHNDWSPNTADEVCQYFGHSSSSSVVYQSLGAAGLTDVNSFMILQNRYNTIAANETVLSRFTEIPICPSQKVVRISCQPMVCGERKVDVVTPYIVGGNIATPGKWPWVVSVSILGQEVCGGTVIGQRWILTAAHCIVSSVANYTSTPHFLEITAGTNVRIRTTSDNAQRRRVTKIVLHPQMKGLITGVTDWDLALLQLDAPLDYGDYLQPLCLPYQGEEFSTKSQCYLAGWGYINTQEVTVNELRDGKMKLWNEEDCSSNLFGNWMATNSTICTGYHAGVISACQGDSGSPLMCKDSRNHWKLVGVMSHGINGCSGESSSRPNRYAKVASAVDWILSVIDKS